MGFRKVHLFDSTAPLVTESQDRNSLKLNFSASELEQFRILTRKKYQ